MVLKAKASGPSSTAPARVGREQLGARKGRNKVQWTLENWLGSRDRSSENSGGGTISSGKQNGSLGLRVRDIRARFESSSVASGPMEGSRKVVLDPALG